MPSNLAAEILNLMGRSSGHRPPEVRTVAAATALAAYRTRLGQACRHAGGRGIEGGMGAGDAAPSLDEVYVPARLVPELQHAPNRECEPLRLHDEVRLAEFAESWLTGQGPPSQPAGQPAAAALATARHAVVIGGPGAGKTSLVAFLARTCSLGEEAIRDRLGWEEALTPVVLPLAAFADGRSRDPALTLHRFLDAGLVEEGGEALREAVGEAPSASWPAAR